MKRFFVYCFCLILLCLSGCGKPSQDPNTLVVWHWMVDRHETFKSLSEKYKAETGITVDFKLYAPSDVYSQKIIASAQARILPDIYGILDTKGILADFIKSEFVADLTAYFSADNNAWEKSLFAKALGTSRFKEGNVHNIKGVAMFTLFLLVKTKPF